MNLAALGSTLLDRVSERTGLNVDADRVAVSALSGTLTLDGLTVRLPDAPPDRPPLLAVRRVRAQVALRSLLAGKLRVKQAAVERPVVRASVEQLSELARVLGERAVPTAGANGDEMLLSEVTIDRLLVVDASADVMAEDHAIALRIAGVSAEWEQVAGGYDVNVLVDRVGPSRMADAIAWPAEAQATIHLRGPHDLMKVGNGALKLEASLRGSGHANLELDLSASAERVGDMGGAFSLRGIAPPSALRELAPPVMRERVPNLGGRLKLTARGRIDRAGLSVSEFILTGADLRAVDARVARA